MLKIGATIPDVTLSAPDGRLVALRALVRESPRLIFFYPGDSTPVCTKQACFYRDEAATLAASGVQVVGIGPKGPESKARFQAEHALNFLLLADPEGEAARAFGIVALFGLMRRRVSFLVDTDGVVRGRAKGELRLQEHLALARRASELLQPPSGA